MHSKTFRSAFSACLALLSPLAGINVSSATEQTPPPAAAKASAARKLRETTIEPTAPAANPIVQIVIRFQSESQRSHQYTVTLNKDGAVLFDGAIGDLRRSVPSGHISERDWKHIAAAFKRDDFFGLKAGYYDNVAPDGHSASYTFDQASITTIVTRKDGSKKSVCDYGDTGPQVLWELDNLVLSVAETITGTLERPVAYDGSKIDARPCVVPQVLPRPY